MNIWIISVVDWSNNEHFTAAYLTLADVQAYMHELKANAIADGDESVEGNALELRADTWEAVAELKELHGGAA